MDNAKSYMEDVELYFPKLTEAQENWLIMVINTSRVRVLTQVYNQIKTKQVGFKGDWTDADVDKSIIQDFIMKCRE